MTIKQMIKYREIWMGIAMLSVMIYHSGIQFPIELLNKIKEIAYGGVDIFLFASGIGNYYSYTKSEAPLEFIKRRILRLAPIYIPFMIVWGLYHIVMGQMNAVVFVGNLFAVQTLSHSGISFNWYLAALIVFYVLTPYLATFIKKNTLGKCIVLVAAAILLSTAFFNDRKFIVLATRLPIYIIGMMFAKYDAQIIKKKYALSAALLFAASVAALYACRAYVPRYLWNYGLHWYPYILMTPFLCYVISCVSRWSEGCKPIRYVQRCIGLLGKYSFELYLVHIFVFKLVSYWWKVFHVPFPLGNVAWILVMILVFLLAWILHIIAKQVEKLICLCARSDG